MDLVLQTLERKRAEIIGAIKRHEAAIAQAKHDLAHVSATLKLLGQPGGEGRAYIVAQGFFAKGELAAMCQRHLADGPLNTRELAERVMAEKRLDASERAVAQLGRPQGRSGPETRNAAQCRGVGGEAGRAVCVAAAGPSTARLICRESRIERWVWRLV